MADSQMTLSGEEREFLVGLLEIALKDTRIEEHRTRNLTYREHIVQREDLITAVLTKLQKQSG